MPDPSVSRREFARRLALGAGATVTGLATASPAAEQQPAGPEATETPPPPEPEDFQLAALVQQYPSEHLTPEMLVSIRAGLRRIHEQAQQLRGVGLQNSDEPAFAFRAYRKD